MLALNKKVLGMYLGTFPFVGTIRSYRPLMVQTDGGYEVTVDLDHPVDIYGRPAESLVVIVKFTGEPSSYTHDSDALYAKPI